MFSVIYEYATVDCLFLDESLVAQNVNDTKDSSSDNKKEGLFKKIHNLIKKFIRMIKRGITKLFNTLKEKFGSAKVSVSDKLVNFVEKTFKVKVMNHRIFPNKVIETLLKNIVDIRILKDFLIPDDLFIDFQYINACTEKLESAGKNVESYIYQFVLGKNRGDIVKDIAKDIYNINFKTNYKDGDNPSKFIIDLSNELEKIIYANRDRFVVVKKDNKKYVVLRKNSLNYLVSAANALRFDRSMDSMFSNVSGTPTSRITNFVTHLDNNLESMVDSVYNKLDNDKYDKSKVINSTNTIVSLYKGLLDVMFKICMDSGRSIDHWFDTTNKLIYDALKKMSNSERQNFFKDMKWQPKEQKKEKTNRKFTDSGYYKSKSWDKKRK